MTLRSKYYMMTEGDESSVTLVQFPPNATLATDADGNIIDSGASATKSRMTAKALPAGGDNIPLLYARTDAVIVSILAVLSGPSGSSVSTIIGDGSLATPSRAITEIILPAPALGTHTLNLTLFDSDGAQPIAATVTFTVVTEGLIITS